VLGWHTPTPKYYKDKVTLQPLFFTKEQNSWAINTP
jgi:hypothetical protein